MAINSKPKPTKPAKPASKWSVLSHPLLSGFILIIASAVVTLTVSYVQRPAPISGEVGTESPNKSHSYSFAVDGKTINGESTSPFEKGNGFYARIESCEQYGIEKIYVIASCYMTIKLTENLTISNSENFTEAIYSDGSPAKICCLYVDNSYHAPLYLIKLPFGSIDRQTYPSGSEIHLKLNIPDMDAAHNLDAIKFAPGEGVAPILFPVQNNIKDRVLSTYFVNAHRNDPALKKLLAELVEEKSKYKIINETNRGLTYRSSN